ncbi:MAG: hypothetical protein H7061_09480 [Bdellovibrionaceae bacterium]|nr:hypothetical protein [Bdellovibrio sp.]
MNPFFQLAKKYKTPREVQRYIDSLKYNKADSVQSAQAGIRSGQVHCLEGAFIAAAILEYHGYEPVIMSLESIDRLDHVVFVFQEKGLWGAVGQSSDRGLRGRAPVFKTLRALAYSYFDPYIDETGCVRAYQLAHLDETQTNWRTSSRNVKKAEDYLIYLKHIKIKYSKRRHYHFRKRWNAKIILPRKIYWW